MSRKELGNVLRLLGPLLQVLSLGFMFLAPDAARYRNLVYWLFGAGLLLVLAGLALSSLPETRPPSHPRDGGSAT
jgi:hypothetical protein